MKKGQQWSEDEACQFQSDMTEHEQRPSGMPVPGSG